MFNVANQQECVRECEKGGGGLEAGCTCSMWRTSRNVCVSVKGGGRAGSRLCVLNV